MKHLTFDVGTNFDKNLINVIAENNKNNQFSSVFGKLKTDFLGGGRSSAFLPDITMEELRDYIELCHKNKLEFNYLINAMCMENKELEADSHIDYCLMKCLSTKIEDMSNLISSDWIRPEDLCYYEKLCEETDNFNLSIKLVERTKSTKFLTRVVEAYARRQYKGNLLDILLWPKSDDMVVKTEPTAEEMKTMAELYNISQMFNYSKIFDLPNIYIDNTKLDGFLKKFVDDYACNHKICVSKQNIDVTDSNYCSYCSSWVQRAIIYNGEQVEKWIDNCREFEKALDRSEVFRSVL